MSGGRGRSGGSLPNLIALLLSMRDDPVTDQFDRVLIDAERAGRIDPALARTLRWWQRQGLQGQADYFADVLPRILTALAEADDVTELGLEQARLAWESAEPSAVRLVTSVVVPSARPPAGPPMTAPNFEPATQGNPETKATAQSPADARQTSTSPSGVVSRRLLIAGLTVKASPDTPPTSIAPDTEPESPPP